MGFFQNIQHSAKMYLIGFLLMSAVFAGYYMSVKAFVLYMPGIITSWFKFVVAYRPTVITFAIFLWIWGYFKDFKILIFLIAGVFLFMKYIFLPAFI